MTKQGEKPGDCFVIMNAHGLVWTGDTWSFALADALAFDDEPHPYKDAAREVERLRGRGGRPFVFYVPEADRDEFFRRRDTSTGAGKPARKSADDTSVG